MPGFHCGNALALRRDRGAGFFIRIQSPFRLGAMRAGIDHSQPEDQRPANIRQRHRTPLPRASVQSERFDLLRASRLRKISHP